MAEYLLSEDFWHDFLRNHWEQKPACLHRLFETPITSANELFETVIGMPTTKTSGDRLWISRKSQPEARDDFSFLPLEIHGPKRQDQSFEEFFNRIQKEFSNSTIGINIHHLEKSNPEIWFRFRDFVSDLNRLSGQLPSGRWDIDTFFGTYKVTPLGIHKDNASVFAMGIMGNRTYYTWPADYFKEGDEILSTLDVSAIEPHLENAVRMDLEPGSVIYWPSSNWHLVVSDGHPSAAVSISAYFGEKLSSIISNQIRHLIATQLEDNNFHKVFEFTGNPAKPPQSLITTHGLLVQMAQKGLVSDGLQQYWLMLSTADGLHSVPANTDSTLKPEARICVNPRYPIVWAKSSGDSHLVASNGLVFSMSTVDNTAILEIFKELNSGQCFTVDDFVKHHAQEDIPAEKILEILSLLHRCRAFRLVKA